MNEPGRSRSSSPSRSLRRSLTVVASALAVGVLAGGLLQAGARWWVPAALDGPLGDGGWTARSRAWFTTEGFSPAELDTTSLQHFTWTGGSSTLRLPHLDRSQVYEVTFTVSAGRPPDAPAPPELLVLVDGLVAGTFQTSNAREALSVTIPPRRRDGAAVTLAVSETWVPGPHDPRALGIVVHDVRLEPAFRFSSRSQVTVAAGQAVALAVLGILLCGGLGAWSWLAAAALSLAWVWLLLVDGAFLGTFVDRLTWVGWAIAGLGAALGLVRWRRLWMDGPAEWPAALTLTLSACAIKVAIFAHPMVTVGDGIFQVHRAQLVHAGQYFFTSITPRPFFEFPYPVALYVAAQPFWDFFPTKLDLLLLLRGLSTAADGLVGLALYAAARRQWQDGKAALLCVVLWSFARAPFHALCNANLTNVFGQSLFTVAMAGLAWAAAGRRASVAALAGASAVLALAYLSHFGTLLVGVPLVGVVGLVLVSFGRDVVRRTGVWVLMVGLTAVAVSYVVYYSHFTEVYRQTSARVASREGEAPTRSIVAPPAVKFQRWITETSDDYGLPAALLFGASVWGGLLLARRRPRDGLTLVLGGWTLVWVGLTALGIFSPVQTRVNLAAAPVFVCAGAYGLAALSARGRPAAWVTVVVTAAIAWQGIRLWAMCLGQ